ncbi:MAG: ribonuclease Z [Patescibacteria group bacterium]|nr:ribonuclease Z [Patescibacteria group bacterium]
MKLVIIGSGTCIIRPNRHGPAFLLDTGKLKILFDCGWGAGENLVRAGYSISELDHIFITHPHADHMASLISLLQHTLVAGNHYPKTRRTKPLYLHGYKGFKKDYEELRRMMFPERVEKYPIRVLEYLNTERSLPGFKVVSCEVPHVPRFFKAVSYRLKIGQKVFMYSGDTSWSPALAKLASKADVALLEASVSPKMYKSLGPRPNHLSAYECGLVAAEAIVKRLVLVHLYGTETEQQLTRAVRKNFSGRLFVAEDFMRINI